MKKKNNNSKIVIVVILVVAVLAVAGGIIYNNYSKANNFVATIAGDKVSVPEFKFFLKIVKQNYEDSAGVVSADEAAVKEFWKTPMQGENAEVKAKNDSLDKLKEFKVLLSKAKESKTQLDNTELDEIKKAIDKIVTDEGKGNRAAASASIKRKYGITLNEYEAIYKDYMLAYGKYLKKLTDDVATNEKDLKDFFDKNKDKFGDYQTKQVILLTMDLEKNTALPADQVASKKALANDIYNKAKAGENFDTLINQYTEDPNVQEHGGEYRILKDDTKADSKVKEWILNAKDGDIGLVEASYGYVIIKFLKKIEYGNITDEVKQVYKSSQVDQKVESWKKEAKFNIIKNQKVLDKIKVVQ